jgi:cellulose synthase (UDP-forming)
MWRTASRLDAMKQPIEPIESIKYRLLPRVGTMLLTLLERASKGTSLIARGLTALLLALGIGLFFLVITTPLDNTSQVLFAACCLAMAFLIKRRHTKPALMIMIVLSLVASSRYLYWRLTETIATGSMLDLFFGTGLLVAELYAFVVLVFGFIQTAWPLERKPVLMPPDQDSWPTVDVFIPTYNEALAVVKPTVFAALALDWPADKIRIYVLDDGRRPEFAAFCASVGVTHVTRADNSHAKAGNINAALPNTSGELIAIFDCDHIPTRSFLQIAGGWFVKNKNIAMLQTPHYFFSPDPFEKNLGTFRNTPNEGELFYGLIQNGNDLWNASFFCGSCAVLRRSALLEINGIAIETVTEDAHTALKLHRLGYETAYLGIPQAAGLATESLSSHVGQRIRWARGMAQIFRIDNPLLGKGLSLGQRLCYMNAMLHFFYGVPRIIFLTAPLAYLIFGAQVISASALDILIFVVPHLVHSTITNSRIQGRFRHSFWNEVYESVLAWYILRPTLYAFINPKAGKFNVTVKGGMTAQNFFDWSISLPFVVLIGFNLLGFILGCLLLTWWQNGEASTVLLNMAWTAQNLLILGAATAVASEARQVRHNHRIPMRLAATLHLPGGRTMACETENFSEGGLSVILPTSLEIEQQQRLNISLYRGNEEFVFPIEAVRINDLQLSLKFHDLSLQQETDLVQCSFARANTWVDSWGRAKQDKPLRALRQIFRIGAGGIKELLHQFSSEIHDGLRRKTKTPSTTESA